MPRYWIRYTEESWREVIVEGDNEEDALSGFFNDKGVDWDTDREYDRYIDYDNADVYQHEGE